MRLEKEGYSDIQEDTVEYKSAIKSVIRCQIQSLLQKLAAETGEESILISTNVAAGTYNHLGSHLGKDYLEDGDEIVQVICEKFTSFCAELQFQDSNSESSAQKTNLSPGNIDVASQYKSLPAPKRKRLFDTSPDNPSSKRRPLQYLSNDSSSHTLNNSAHVDTSPGKTGDKQGNESQPGLSVSRNGEGQGQSLSWIKIEPRDDDAYQPSVNGTEQSHSVLKNSDSYNYEDPSQTSIINRPKSLIPLANIYRRYGTSKPIKVESPVHFNTEENSMQDKSILRSLYEQPLYKIVDQMQEDAVRSADVRESSLAVQSNLNEETFSGSSENLVLSGYYDSDSYPSYRHKQKHPANPQSQKKSKNKEKIILSEPFPEVSSQYVHLRTFESGGRLVYACDVCNRELSHLTSYRRHMKLHTMERPHKCPVCSKGFIRKYHCIDHLNKHHKGVEFDADTLKLTGSSIKEEIEHETSALMTSTPEPGEYNYTLDQSFDDNTSLLNTSDNDLSLNPSHLNQSASAMLSELAKSAAKSQMNTVLNFSPLVNDKPEQESVHNGEQGPNDPGDKTELGKESCHDNEVETEDIGVTSQQSSDVSPLSNQSEDLKLEQGTSHVEEDMEGTQLTQYESKADMRKNEVSEGIKAIVEHLKTSSKNKRKRVPPKALTTDMVN